jgi:hypothetical protein
MEIRLYSDFVKKSNSTKRPTGNYTTVVGELKSPTNIINPTFLLQNFNNPTNYSFVYIPVWDRYYHVTNWTYNAGLWEMTTHVDTLATYKNNILNQSAYVLYSTSNYNDQLVDQRLTNRCEPSFAYAHASIFTELQASSYGCFALNIISSAGRWGTATYIMDGRQLTTLLELLCIDTPQELTDQMQQLFAGASINSIISCTWLPWLHESHEDTVIIGGYDTGVQAEKIDYPEYYEASNVINIPYPYNDWRRSPLYMSACIYLPYYGVRALPMDKLIRSNNISISCAIDYSTGGATYMIRSDTFGLVDCVSFNIGCNIPVSGMSINPYEALKEGITGSASAFKLDFSGTAESAFEAFQNLTMPQVSTSGAYGQSRSNCAVTIQQGFGNLIRLWLFYYEFSDEPSDMAPNIGRPLFAVRQLSTLSGYVQTANFSSECGLEPEVEEINSYLNGGIYIE